MEGDILVNKYRKHKYMFVWPKPGTQWGKDGLIKTWHLLSVFKPFAITHLLSVPGSPQWSMIMNVVGKSELQRAKYHL